MGPMLVVHIVAGGLGLVLGALALTARKGARLHRQSGMLFAYAMLTMCVFGTVLAVTKNHAPTLNEAKAKFREAWEKAQGTPLTDR